METREFEPQPHFVVKRMTLADSDEATEMRLQSWLDTYVNDDIGVTREWIEERNKTQRSPERRQSRTDRFKQGMAEGTFNAWVARDTAGKIIGSTTPFIDAEGRQRLGSLYVDKAWHGKGVGGALMKQAVEWLDSTMPIELTVVSYNERAKAFYRKWGFEEVPHSEDLFDEKIPEVTMVRKPNYEA